MTMDIRALETRSMPHDALACPVGISRVPVDIECPDFAVSETELLTGIQALISAEPRTKFVAHNDALRQLVFVQRSRLFRFPDTIWIQVVNPVDPGDNVSLIIYSRSNYGYWDLGVNKRRVRRWLAKLAEQIETTATAC